MNRREALQAAGVAAAGATAASVLGALTSAWQSSQPRLPGATVSRAMIDDWTLGFEVHRRTYATGHPQPALVGLTRDWADLAPHLATEQPEVVGRELAHVAARYSYLIAMGFQQTGDLRMAARWWRTAHFHADQSGDALLGSETRSWETTYRVVEAGEDLPVLHRLALSAREKAGRRPSNALVRALTVEAQVLAWMGLRSEAVTTMREAEDVFERLPVGGLQAEKNLRFDQSLVYSMVEATNLANEAREAAQLLYPSARAPHTSAQLALHGVILHARTDPAEAGRQALSILDQVPEKVRVKRVVLAARRITEAVPEDARLLPPVRELRALTA